MNKLISLLAAFAVLIGGSIVTAEPGRDKDWPPETPGWKFKPSKPPKDNPQPNTPPKKDPPAKKDPPKDPPKKDPPKKDPPKKGSEPAK